METSSTKLKQESKRETKRRKNESDVVEDYPNNRKLAWQTWAAEKKNGKNVYRH